MIRDLVIACLIIGGATLLGLTESHGQAATRAIQWWSQLELEARGQLLAVGRGLNVAVIDGEGGLEEARTFDTYLNPNSGFDRYVASLQPSAWVVVVVKDEAATSLNDRDVAALQSLGGTAGLRGNKHWSYILVGRPNLGAGRGLERISEKALTLELPAGQEIAGQPLPLGMRIDSAGFYQGNFASLTRLPTHYDGLRRWLAAVLSRM
ncbi:MAG: interleukin-like EMT inducer domain-containing protein [Mycobacterium leprae]